MLTKLDLSRNLISEIPKSCPFFNLCELDVLLVSHNKISGPIAQGIFAGMQKLTHLDLSNNEISLLPPDIGQVSAP